MASCCIGTVQYIINILVHYVFINYRVAGKKPSKRTKSINGSLYIFRGRINTEVMEVENVEDGTGKDQLIFVSKGQGIDVLLLTLNGIVPTLLEVIWGIFLDSQLWLNL